MTVPVWLFRNKKIPYPSWRRKGWLKFGVLSRMRKKVVFSPSLLSFTYENIVASRVLGAAPPCLPTWISHKHPMLNNFLTCHYASRWILSALRQKIPSSLESWNTFCGVTCLSVPPVWGGRGFPCNFTSPTDLRRVASFFSICSAFYLWLKWRGVV